MPMREILGELLKVVPLMDAANYNVNKKKDVTRIVKDYFLARLR